MFQIPQYVLEKLRCSFCDGYLSSKPLMVRPESQQVCGKCYKLLPTEEKGKCVRQIGLEIVAEVISFPCRYIDQGCPYKFKLCDENDHEANCLYKPLVVFSNESRAYSNVSTTCNGFINNENEMHCDTNQIKASLNYKINDSNECRNLIYALNIRGNCEQSLVIKNTVTQETEEIEIRMDGTVFLGNKPELLHSEIIVKPLIKQNIYETLRNYDCSGKACVNCGQAADPNYCLLGHPSCTKCKSSICIRCVRVLEKEAKTVCKNYDKGCKETLDLDSRHRHESNCEFTDYKCILESCNFVSTLPNIKQHIITDHTSEIFQSNEVNKKLTSKDETFIVYCYGNVFRCVYFYYKSFVEFLVTHIGSIDEAVNFYYEVIVNIKGYVISKRSKCSNWNNCMLEKGITFERTDLVGTNEKKMNLELTLRIINKR